MHFLHSSYVAVADTESEKKILGLHQTIFICVVAIAVGLCILAVAMFIFLLIIRRSKRGNLDIDKEKQPEEEGLNAAELPNSTCID